MFKLRRILLISTTLAFLAAGVLISSLLFGIFNPPRAQRPVELSGHTVQSAKVDHAKTPSAIQSSQHQEVNPGANISLVTAVDEPFMPARIQVADPLAAAENSVADDQFLAESENNATSQLAHVPPTLVADIEAIRSEVGISALPLASDDQFRSALEAVAQSEGLVDSLVATGDQVWDDQVRDVEHTATTNDTVDYDSHQVDKAADAFIRSMEAAIVELNRRADLMEQKQEYEAADRMRRLVRKLRKEIRPLK